MFSFLKSKRQKWKEQSEATFANFIPVLKGMDGQEIGFVLDLAANIRRASTTSLSNDDSYGLAFCDPMALREDDAFRYLKYWKEWMVGLDQTESEMAKAGALCIWWLSLMGGTIAEARVNARIMWGELERGFEYCKVFIPNEMVPKGLAPMPESIKKEAHTTVDEGPKSSPDSQGEFSSFISYRKNVTGQFHELIERHYTSRTPEALEKAIKDKTALLPDQFLLNDTKEFIGDHALYSVEQFLGDCYEFSTEKGYWEKDTAAIFDQITRHASIRMQLMHIVESVNDTKFTLFQLAVLTFALEAHNNPVLRAMLLSLRHVKAGKMADRY
jgi:hypothetical protein